MYCAIFLDLRVVCVPSRKFNVCARQSSSRMWCLWSPRELRSCASQGEELNSSAAKRTRAPWGSSRWEKQQRRHLCLFLALAAKTCPDKLFKVSKISIWLLHRCLTLAAHVALVKPARSHTCAAAQLAFVQHAQAINSSGKSYTIWDISGKESVQS